MEGGPVLGFALLAHGGRVPGDEFAVITLGVLLALVVLSGMHRATSPPTSSPPAEADTHDDRTDPEVPQDG